MQAKISIILAVFGLLFSQMSQSQEIAVTTRGDSVVLYSNGYWDYYYNYINGEGTSEEIRMNSEPYEKPANSTIKINGMNDAYRIWYNDKAWRRIPPAELNPEADIALKLKDGDVYGMVIYEQLEIPMENLVDIALENGKNAAPDIRLVDREYRIVNNDTLVMMRMDGTTQGMKISYYSYYFSNENGSIQFHTFTGQNMIDKYLKEIEDLLNGFFVQ